VTVPALQSNRSWKVCDRSGPTIEPKLEGQRPFRPTIQAESARRGEIVACQGGGAVIGSARFASGNIRVREPGTPEKTMKKDIHPKYDEATISCACGYVLKTRSTVKSMNINTCANCHPYFTGQAKFIDTEGRVDRFNKRYQRKPATAKK
jgi:large subunit ribosomal protein L31